MTEKGVVVTGLGNIAEESGAAAGAQGHGKVGEEQPTWSSGGAWAHGGGT